MIKKCLLAAAVTAAALLCLTGCQPKEDPLQLGSTAVVLETDEAQNGLNGTEADLSLQSEAVPEVTAGRAASLEESDYKGFAGQIQKVFSERDIEALSRLCAYPVYVTTEANTEGQDVADAAALIAQKDDLYRRHASGHRRSGSGRADAVTGRHLHRQRIRIARSLLFFNRGWTAEYYGH